MKIDCSRQTCAMKGVAICENGVAISSSTSRAPCRSQKKYFLVEATCDLYRDFEIKDVINIIFRMDSVQKKRKGQS